MKIFLFSLFLYISDMSLGLSVSMHFHVSESWECMRNECYMKDIILET